MDCFDRVPDSLVLLIFNSVSDIKTLIRCRIVCKRFNSLVPQAESLLLRVDRVVSPDSEEDSAIVSLLRSLIKSLQELLSFKSVSTRTKPVQILSQFERIRNLTIELPAGDLESEEGSVIKYRAEFGETLRSCVIFGYNENGGNGNSEEGFKKRVVWTISALVAASARHYLMKEMTMELRDMERLVVEDREGEGVVVMGKEGFRDWRRRGKEEREAWLGGTRVPSVRMRMRHARRIGEYEGATLVVAKPAVGEKEGELEDDGSLAMAAFGEGVYADAVKCLLKSRGYMLEMNAF